MKNGYFALSQKGQDFSTFEEVIQLLFYILSQTKILSMYLQPYGYINVKKMAFNCFPLLVHLVLHFL